MNNLARHLSNYLSLVKFSHTIFAMPFAITGYFLAVTLDEHHFSIRLLILVILCMIFARNSAMAFNRYADRKIDHVNPRTTNREIPSGVITGRGALVFVIINSLLFIVAAGLINRLTLMLSPVALLVILGYSYTKRFTWICHFILGLGLSLAPTGAYIAVTGQFAPLPVIYSLIVLTWVGGFDIIYALQDDKFDRSNNLFSVPSRFGQKRARIFSAISHIITIVLVTAAGIYGEAGYLYLIGAILFAMLMVFQHIIIESGNIKSIKFAFGTINGVAGVIFCSFVIADLLLV